MKILKSLAVAGSLFLASCASLPGGVTPAQLQAAITQACGVVVPATSELAALLAAYPVAATAAQIAAAFCTLANPPNVSASAALTHRTYVVQMYGVTLHATKK